MARRHAGFDQRLHIALRRALLSEMAPWRARVVGDRSAAARRLWLLPVVALLWLASASGQRSIAVSPKYGPQTALLRVDHAHVREQPAPDFWALMPYYLPQTTDSSCSVAALAMLVNALRSKAPLTSADALVTHAGLLKEVGNAEWTAAVASGGDGVALDDLPERIRESLEAYRVPAVATTVRHVDVVSDKTLEEFREALVANEASDRDFMLVNFLQSVATGDPQGAIGHIAPVAAYDAKSQRVLLLDPDRQWYEPYWVPDRQLLLAMSTTDKTSGRGRGYVWVKASEPAAAP